MSYLVHRCCVVCGRKFSFRSDNRPPDEKFCPECRTS